MAAETQPPPPPPPIEVRRHLQAIRRAWANNHPVDPMHLCLEIAPNLSISEFCFRVVSQQHRRPRARGARGGGSSA